jgi:hypothetical protein
MLADVIVNAKSASGNDFSLKAGACQSDRMSAPV